MSLETIHCEQCEGTGRVFAVTRGGVENYVVCLSCKGTGLWTLTPEQSARRRRDAEAAKAAREAEWIRTAPQRAAEAQNQRIVGAFLLAAPWAGLGTLVGLIVGACRGLNGSSLQEFGITVLICALIVYAIGWLLQYFFDVLG